MPVVYDIIPRTHAEIGLKYIIGNKIVETADEVKQYLQQLLNDALAFTIIETEIWINNHVPMETGALRESLISFLKKSIPPVVALGELRGIRLVLGVGAEIAYAQYVNKMTTSQVRHPIDPRAYGFYHDKMVDFAIERFDINTGKAIYKFNSGA